MWILGIDFITGFSLGVEYIFKGEADEDTSYLLIELGIIRFSISFS